MSFDDMFSGNFGNIGLDMNERKKGKKSTGMNFGDIGLDMGFSSGGMSDGGKPHIVKQGGKNYIEDPTRPGKLVRVVRGKVIGRGGKKISINQLSKGVQNNNDMFGIGDIGFNINQGINDSIFGDTRKGLAGMQESYSNIKNTTQKIHDKWKGKPSPTGDLLPKDKQFSTRRIADGLFAVQSPSGFIEENSVTKIKKNADELARDKNYFAYQTERRKPSPEMRTKEVFHKFKNKFRRNNGEEEQ